MSTQEEFETSKFIFIFICENEVLLEDKTDLFPMKGIVATDNSHSWNEIAINISKKVSTFSYI